MRVEFIGAHIHGAVCDARITFKVLGGKIQNLIIDPSIGTCVLACILTGRKNGEMEVTIEIDTKGPGGVVVRRSKLFQVLGSLNGKDGIFEWILDNDKITHRRFIAKGEITGYPNQVVKTKGRK